MPIMPTDKLPQGRYGCTGHVINLPPGCHLPSELDAIVVRKTMLINNLNILLTGNVITQCTI